MKKNLFLSIIFSLPATYYSQVLSYVGQGAVMYVSKNTLLYNGGGMQIEGYGVVENHGNVMLVGNTSSEFRTDLDATSLITGKFINKLNEPDAFASPAPKSSSDTPAYTYGQLYISGITQDNIKGVVNQEFRAINHGAYQQIGLPFWGKSFSSLSEFGKTFNKERWSQNEVLVWDNARTVFDNLSSDIIGSTDHPAYSYYILGAGGTGSAWASNGLATTRTLVGKPVSDLSNYELTLSGSGSTVSYGVNGNAINEYNEHYNTYLGDNFAYSRGHIWDGVDFGKNLYFFSNPYLTNLDLSNLDKLGPDFLNNLYGIRFEPKAGGTVYQTNIGGTIDSFRYVTRSGGVWVGDTEELMVRPLGTFVIKLNDNSSTTSKINFKFLRRFNYYPRPSGTTYSHTAKMGNSSSGTVKELAVIGLDKNGYEVARSYYVVSPFSTTGNSLDATSQVANTNKSVLGTFEENPSIGGYDDNYTSKYWLYINEANDTFVGKNVKLVKYTGDISTFKFIIKENGKELADNVSDLSTGLGFYFKGPNGELRSVAQGLILDASGGNVQDYDLYYGKPDSTLNSNENKVPSRTVVLYNAATDNYIVRFDPKWNRADVFVFDLSGKLISSEKTIGTSSDYSIPVQKHSNAVYIVKAISDKGEVVQSKIIVK